MELSNLIGKEFKYISPHDGKSSNWVGIVKDYSIHEHDIDCETFKPDIIIMSEHGIPYSISELIFLKNKNK